MEPLSIMGAIFKVAQEIAKAARTARRNRSRCLELAERARIVGDLLRDSKAAKDMATRTRVLGRLSEALGDALKLVQSCRRGGLISRLLSAGRDAGRFDGVERKINNCLMDLGIANDARLERQVNQLAARGNHPGTNAKAGSQKKINHNTKKDVAMNGNKSSTAAAGERTNKGRYADGKGKQMTETRPGLRHAAATGSTTGHRGTGVPYYPEYVISKQNKIRCSSFRPISAITQSTQTTQTSQSTQTTTQTTQTTQSTLSTVEEDPNFCSVM